MTPPNNPQVSWDDIEAGDVAFFMMEHLESQRRIYDALLAMISMSSRDTANSLLSAHKRGEFLYPPPWGDQLGDDDVE
ncbi:MAG: hypothetical protein LC650_00785 [Actinobacteria bacterium]|nr:hypothetical protein [Actinomycetota bacterium]